MQDKVEPRNVKIFCAVCVLIQNEFVTTTFDKSKGKVRSKKKEKLYYYFLNQTVNVNRVNF
jgi:hypothetical protein